MTQTALGNGVIESPYVSYANTGTANLALASGPGVLGIVTHGGHGTGTIKLYDDPNGDANNPIADFDSTATPRNFIFDCIFNNGLTLVTTGNINIIVSYCSASDTQTH